MTRELLVRVRAPHYCAVLSIVDGVCTEAAPILRWALGKPWRRLREYFLRKQFEVIVMVQDAAGEWVKT